MNTQGLGSKFYDPGTGVGTCTSILRSSGRAKYLVDSQYQVGRAAVLRDLLQGLTGTKDVQKVDLGKQYEIEKQVDKLKDIPLQQASIYSKMESGVSDAQ